MSAVNGKPHPFEYVLSLLDLIIMQQNAGNPDTSYFYSIGALKNHRIKPFG